MACPRCGCRMVTKMGSGRQAHLICSDCGTRLPGSGLDRPGSGPTQLLTGLLLVLFGLTAAGLMWISDRHTHSLLEEESLNLSNPRSEAPAAGEADKR